MVTRLGYTRAILGPYRGHCWPILIQNKTKLTKHNQKHPKNPQIDAMIPPLVLLYICGHIGVVLIKNKTKLPKLNQKHSNKAQIDAPIPPLVRPYPCGCFRVVLIKIIPRRWFGYSLKICDFIFFSEHIHKS